MTADLELAYLPAVELARRIRAREISPVEAVANALDRIEAVNPVLNCFCFVYPEEALARAKEAERAVMAGADLGPLHGLPIAIKDFTPTRGKTTTLGSKIYADWAPDEDALVARRLLAAGAILVGKTTTPEFAYSSFTESPLWGVTRNPWDPARTPGGSSGGSGAAVASGCVALAEGSDAGGSIRIPASFCGLVGLKPSFGRIPFAALPTAFDTLFHFGPLARGVADAALFLQATQGPDERDILSLPQRADIAVPPPGDLRGLKVAFSPDLGYYAIAPDVAANTRAAADALAERGAVVEEVALAWSREINDAWFAHWGVLLAACFGQHLPEWRERMTPEVVSLMERGLAMGAVDFKRLEFVRTRQWEVLRQVFEGHDILLCPTMAQTAPLIGGEDSDFEEDDEAGRYKGLDLTSPFNFVSPCPVVSVPSGVDSLGLPTGVQIAGRRYDDPTVLRAAAALEAARPWHQRRPPL